MKFTKLFILALGASMSFTACDNMGFLEIKPDNLVLTKDTVTSPEHLQKFMVDAYSSVRSTGFMGGEMFVAQDVLAGDGATLKGEFNWSQILSYSMNLFNEVGRHAWDETYSCINKANFAAFSSTADGILAKADPAVKTQLEADACFIRGLGFFHLVRIFGLPYDETTKDVDQMGIPLRKRGTASMNDAFVTVQRSSVGATYEQIVSDLKFAAANLPANRTWDCGFATRDIANAVLAKVYFFMGNMEEAEKAAALVIDKYDLDTDPTAKFARASKGTTTQEVIFMIPSTGKSNDSWGAIKGMYRTDDPAKGDAQWMASNDLFEQFAGDDKRGEIFYMTKDGIHYTTKFDYDNMDCIIMGENELLLIYAEAAAKINLSKAIASLQKIEQRAYGSVKTSNQASAATVIANAQKERRLELALQGERLHEMKRLHIKVKSYDWNSNRLLFQIPDSEQNGNPDIKLN